MGCAASSTVNIADDVKSMDNPGNAQSPKPLVDSGDLEAVGTLNYGDQNDKISQEIINFHNSPIMISPDQQSENLSSQSISYSNKHSKSLHTEIEISKSNQIMVSSPLVNKSNLENDEDLSISHSSIPNKDNKENNSRMSSADPVGDAMRLESANAEELNGGHETPEKFYQLTSPQESMKSTLYSHNSNVVYRPTASSEDERKEFEINRSTELNHVNNSRSVISGTKSLDNEAEAYWNQDQKGVSNGNSVNHVDYDQSSRNSRFSHTYTASNHSPFFDSLNHGYSNCDNDENQNHDEVTETVNGRLILGTGDSENFVDANENYHLIIQRTLPIKDITKTIQDTDDVIDTQTNLLATGDKCFCALDHSNEDNTLDLDNNQLNNELSDDYRPSSQQPFSNVLNPCALNNDNELNLQSEYIKTAEVNDERCEGILIGISSSPVNSNSGQTLDQTPVDEET